MKREILLKMPEPIYDFLNAAVWTGSREQKDNISLLYSLKGDAWFECRGQSYVRGFKKIRN